MMESALYFGSVRHRRFRPAKHEFEYPLFMAFLDVERIPKLMRASRLASYNRWNWASFYESDHFGDVRKPLRQRMEEDATRNGVQLPDGQIFLLTHLRYLGYNFNPVSFFYCFDREEKLRVILAEVNNTFGETQNYWLSASSEVAGSEKARSFEFPKAFHVSPFMGMACRYHWTFTPPGESLVVQTNVAENGEAIFDGSLILDRRPWSSKWIRYALLHFPWITAKTIAAIHWEAARLYLKKVPIVQHPGRARFSAANTRHWGASWSTK
ncbi:MAG: DUF1365 domain-containing protein [Candidatus Acidiferrales bacterium]